MSKREAGMPSVEQKSNISLNQEQIDLIKMRADVRRRDQILRVEIMNIKQPWATDAMKEREEQVRQTVLAEARGYESSLAGKSADELLAQADALQDRADEATKIFPDLAVYQLSRVVKLRMLAGSDVSKELEIARKARERSNVKFNTAAANLLPDAIILGVQKKLIERKPLPSPEQVAVMVATDKKILVDYALVLTEKERPGFLALIPDKDRREVAIMLDEAVAKVLHQAIVEKDTDEDKQRKEVRLRVFRELQQTLKEGKKSDKFMAAKLARAMLKLGGDSRLLLLELARDEMEGERFGVSNEAEYLPYVLGVLMKEFDDYRINDVALQLVGDTRTPVPVAISLLHKLVRRGYVPATVDEWWKKRNEGFDSTKKYSEYKELQEDHKKRLVLLQKVIADLGVVPSKDVLEFLDDDKRWKGASLDERVETIQKSQAEFDKAQSQHELVGILAQDEHKAMIYYLLHGGDDRFNLINNYGIDKFKEMLKMIVDLKIHEKPIQMFAQSLKKAGMKPAEIEKIIERLRAGHFPLDHPGQDTQEASFEVSENAAVKNANAEIGRVLGREQLGVVLLFPMYRDYLEKENGGQAKTFLKEMQAAHTFSDRLRMIGEIETAYPDFQAKVKAELEDSWKALGEKMVLEVSLEQVFTGQSVPVRGEELIPRLNSKRVDLKRMKKDLLVALRGGNEKLEKIYAEISKKKKARSGLSAGLEKQTDPAKKKELEKKLEELDRDLGDLEAQKALVNNAKTSERFSHLGKAEKDEEIERISREIIALTEKSASAIFTYLTMQVLGEDRLREQDVALVQEMESHLQGPFQTVNDFLTYQPTGKEKTEKKNQRVTLCYLDKVKRLMNMVRFADSKICCFSSINYEMKVQHETANKYWVASINADPMSFVISMEIPQGEVAAEARQSKSVENLGFIFGSFSIDNDGLPGIMLNGIYYAPGIEDSKQVAAIMEKVEKIFEGIPLKHIALASQHGGSIKLPNEYTNETVELIRLRGLDDNSGSPETKVYDDIGTNESLNTAKVYNAGDSGSLWHKRVK
ncbi:MAG: hypothetical protein AAB766_02960 [Patescibacteria group bacterium]